MMLSGCFSAFLVSGATVRNAAEAPAAAPVTGADMVVLGPAKIQRRLRADVRARKTLEKVLGLLGFVRIYSERGVSWVLEKDGDGGLLAISEDGTVVINGSVRCLVSMDHTTMGMPHGDLVLSKVLSLCTKARQKISTLHRDDQKALDRLLPLERTRPLVAKCIREVALEERQTREAGGAGHDRAHRDGD